MPSAVPVSLRKNEAGASLIEVMVSMLLLSVALLGLATAFPKSRVAVQGGSQITVATNLARRALEEMRNVRYTATVDDITPTNFGAQAYGAIPDFPTFRRVVDIQNNTPEANCLPAPPMPCTKTVTVSIFYRDERGQEQSVALRTIFVR